MNIQVRTLDNNYTTLKMSFDNYGNLYFDDEKYSYQVNIDGRNNLYVDKGEFKIDGNKNKRFSKLNVVGKGTKLKEKTLIEVEKLDIFEEETIPEDYFPEDNEYIETDITDSEGLINEDSISKYGLHNTEFNFSSITNDLPIPIYMREDGDITALYDTYIYNNGSMCMKSSSKNAESIYVIKVNCNGTINFRPIGCKEIEYHVLMNSDGKIIFNPT